MAAGLSLDEENIEEFRRQINAQCTLEPDEFICKVVIDVPMPLRYVTEELVQQLELLAPFGKANPRPVFAQKGVMCTNPRIYGANRNVLKTRLSVQSEGSYGMTMVDGIAFRNAEELMERIETGKPLSIVYYPQINEYMGRKNVQIVITRFA